MAEPQALKDEIAAANEKFMSAYKSQDANAVAAMYTEDCKIMPPGSDVVMGRDGVAKVFGNWMTAGAKELLLVIKEVGPLNQTDHCYERSEYTLYKADKTVFDHGKYVIIWRKVGGTWYLYTDVFNTNLSSQ